MSNITQIAKFLRLVGLTELDNAADLLEQQAEAIKGAAVIAAAAGAEIRALKARIADLEARTGEVNIGEVKAMSWLIIQPNERSYVVGDVNKVNIARGCGYAVQAIVDIHPPTGDAAGKDEAIAELRNIANAKRFDREYFDDDSSFADWAQSRARAAIASLTKPADGETS